MEPNTLLIVARTQSLVKRLRAMHDADKYVLRWVSSTRQALALDVEPGLILLDLPLSGGDRCVIRLKERFGVPLLAITHAEQVVPARVDAHLRIPCEVEALLARIESLLLIHSPHVVQAGAMSLETETRRLQIDDSFYQLRPLGCQILAHLMNHPGKAVPRAEIFGRVWGTDDGDNTRALDVHISYLRHEIEHDPHNPRIILTERGIGYRLMPPATPLH
ncbi:MAG: response regulator transcription factor [Anaerolineae bacterium]|nr:response regulator transcription factor [Anaerolineae bacterium]